MQHFIAVLDIFFCFVQLSQGKVRLQADVHVQREGPPPKRQVRGGVVASRQPRRNLCGPIHSFAHAWCCLWNGVQTHRLSNPASIRRTIISNLRSDSKFVVNWFEVEVNVVLQWKRTRKGIQKDQQILCCRQSALKGKIDTCTCIVIRILWHSLSLDASREILKVSPKRCSAIFFLKITKTRPGAHCVLGCFGS